MKVRERDIRIFGNDMERVYNVNESFVAAAVERVLGANVAACRCYVCVEDVYAKALNSLPAKYIQDDYSSHDFAKLVDGAKVEAAVRAAAEVVARNKHHG